MRRARLSVGLNHKVRLFESREFLKFSFSVIAFLFNLSMNLFLLFKTITVVIGSLDFPSIRRVNQLSSKCCIHKSYFTTEFFMIAWQWLFSWLNVIAVLKRQGLFVVLEGARGKIAFKLNAMAHLQLNLW